MDKMTPTINEFANYYEFRGDYDHTPTDGERTMIEDAITGYLEDTGLAQALTTLQGERDRLREALEHEMRDVATEASRYREALKMIAIRAPAQKPEVHEDLDNRGDIADQASALATWECSQIALAALQAPFKEGSERD